ncbi:hypothetical protein NPIL_390081 [Nephila pilipes]|uniref:Uncharacterized protein n=1 Tax=Nephila pilipes TaxID=299642 RepID=A0A8X6US81_NEPPI|nr:hypothetical protein NPIL_390081 [Nephila pilipes]
MEPSPNPDMYNPSSPSEDLPVEDILQAMDKYATYDGLRQITFYIEASLSKALSNPHQTEELQERTMNLSDVLIEARKRCLQASTKEIERLLSARDKDANTWGLSSEVGPIHDS